MYTLYLIKFDWNMYIIIYIHFAIDFLVRLQIDSVRNIWYAFLTITKNTMYLHTHIIMYDVFSIGFFIETSIIICIGISIYLYACGVNDISLMCFTWFLYIGAPNFKLYILYYYSYGGVYIGILCTESREVIRWLTTTTPLQNSDRARPTWYIIFFFCQQSPIATFL